MAEPDGFTSFVVARRTAMLRLAWLLTADWHQAEDLVQTALVKCYPSWDRIADGNPDAYVRRAIVSVHSSWWRRRWRHEVPTPALPERATDAPDLDTVDVRRMLITALAELPPRQRAVVVLRHYEDLSEADTATALGCSVGTVKSQNAKALAHLRRHHLLLAEATQGQEVPDARS